jgi:hypothetical protein
MPGGKNKIEIDIIVVLGRLSTIVENSLKKEAREITIILI